MNGSRAPVTAVAIVSLFIIVVMIPFSSVDAALQKGSREADMEFLEFLEYLGTFEAGGEVLDPLALEQLEPDKKKVEKPVKKERRLRAEERSSEKDAGNE